jgi:hypothetical protein
MKVLLPVGLAMIGFLGGGYGAKWIAGAQRSGFEGIAAVAFGALVGAVAGLALGMVLVKRRR